ncbi:MAG TPA: NAD(P)/FAD-dependent oxidoreductase [Devosia sp.]|jgi:thioredoxin reductase|nr:NAD(P)/FAD-dependent oxidoreductase [Devosia sp.]
MEDVIIIGGSFAGLTAAMHLVRARRKVTIIDSNLPRNRYAKEAHNVLGFDGASPFEIREKGLANVLAYPTARHIEGEVVGVGGQLDDFAVRLAGGEALSGRRLILAYGVRDQFPEIPGFAESWGSTVIHCPYCHGYEVAGGRIGLLYSSPASLHVAVLLRDWADDLTLFTNGLDIPDTEEARIQSEGMKVYEGAVTEIVREDNKVKAVRIASGREVPLDALLAHPKVQPSARLHEDLGAATSDAPLGPFLTIDHEFQTTVPGVFAAGDLAGPRHSINGAIYGGSMAAVGCHRSLLGLI